jgi:integrase
MCATPVSWAPAFRQQVVASSSKGWSVFPHRGQMRLQVREGLGSSSVILPYPWQASATGDALLRVRLIYQQVCAGQTLKGAAAIVSGASSRTEHGWASAIEQFEQHKKAFGNAVSEATWQGKYLPTLRIAIDCLESRQPPCNAAELLDAVLIRWDPGSRARQIAAQNLAQFLNYCTQRLHFKSCWMPPPKLAGHVGQRPRGVAKRDGYPMRDAQILRLIDGLPRNESGNRWRFAVQLMATYGLRPEELRYLVLKPGVDGPLLWCTYQKKGGGGQTRPRQLFALPVRDLDRTAPNWNLIGRLQIGEELPPLGPSGRGGESANTYLKRQEIWTQLKAEAAAYGEVLVPYSLRHRYSYEGHRLGIAPKDLSQAMGHSLECHLRAYARFTSNETANAFAEATTRFEKTLELKISNSSHSCQPAHGIAFE